MKRYSEYLLEVFLGRSEKVDYSHLHDDLAKHYEFHDEDHLNSINTYKTTDGSAKIANYLHEMHRKIPHDIRKLGAFTPRAIEQHISNLDGALTLHKAPEHFHVYTGLKSHPIAHKNALEIGSIDSIHPQRGIRTLEHHPDHIKAVLPAFTSTSTRFNVAEDFAYPPIQGAKQLLKIHIPKGSNHGAYIAHVGPLHVSEREFLLKRNTRLHIHPEPEKTKNTWNEPVHVWHAKIV